MKKRISAIILLTSLVLCLLAGCQKEKDTFITQEEAQQIALEALGQPKDQLSSVHVHAGQYEGAPAFSVHIVTKTGEYEYVIRATDGHVLLVGDLKE